MFRTILVPLDGAEFSEQSLPTAMALAKRTHAHIHLVRVHVPKAAEEMWTAAELWTKSPSDDERWEEERQALERTAAEIRTTGIDATATMLREPVVESLTNHAQNIGADLVVMATHGRGPLGRAVLGGVADPLLRRLAAPTLLVQATLDAPKRGHPAPIQHILIALDGSAASEAILPTAVELGEAMGSRFTLIRVVDFTMFYEGGQTDMEKVYPMLEPMHELQVKAARYLEGVAAPLRQRGLNVATTAAINSDPAAKIVAEAHERGCDLIVVGSRGENGWSRLFFGSVEDAVVQTGGAPVLTHATETFPPVEGQ